MGKYIPDPSYAGLQSANVDPSAAAQLGGHKRNTLRLCCGIVACGRIVASHHEGIWCTEGLTEAKTAFQNCLILASAEKCRGQDIASSSTGVQIDTSIAHRQQLVGNKVRYCRSRLTIFNTWKTSVQISIIQWRNTTVTQHRRVIHRWQNDNTTGDIARINFVDHTTQNHLPFVLITMITSS